MVQESNPYRAIIKRLDDLVKSRFIEMFGDTYANTKGWDKEILSSHIELTNGRAYKQEELLDHGKYRVLRVGNFFTNDSWYYSDMELDESKYCDSGDLLYAWSASFGPRIWDAEKVIYHYHIWKVTHDSSYDKDFLFYLLKDITDRLKQGVHGSTMVHLTKEGMEKTELIVPPIQLQKQFSSFLRQVDKSKFIAMQAAEKYDQLVKSRFNDLIDRADIVRLDTLITPFKAEKCGTRDLPVLSITRHEGLILQSDRFKKEIASKNKSQYKIIPRNKLVVAFPIDEGLLSAQTIVDAGIVSPAYDVFSINEDLINPVILERYLRSDAAIQYYLSKLRGTTLRRRTIPRADLDSMLIPLPDIASQERFLSFLKQLSP